MITGSKVNLRALEKKDHALFYAWENDPEIRSMGGFMQPMSSWLVERFIEHASRPLEETGQLRLMIESLAGESLGLMDIFEIDFRNRRAGLGILIGDSKHRGKGLGTEAIRLMCRYAFETLNLELLYADILEENQASLFAFRAAGFSGEVVFPAWDKQGAVRKNVIRVFRDLNR